MELSDTLRRQHGVVSRRQARAGGMSESRIRRLVVAGAWRPVFTGVYAAVDHAFTSASRVWSVMVWAGEDATLAGGGAGWWWDLVDDPPAELVVVLPPGRRRRVPPAGVRVLRRTLDPRDRVHRRGLAVIDLPLAVLETAVELGGEAGARVMDRSLQRRVSLDQLRRARSRAAGRPGAAAMGRLITLAGDRARSALERRTVRLLSEAGLGGWEVNAPLVLGDRRVEVDLLFRAARVAVELKGWAFHSDPASVDADHDRENLLQLAGHLVLQLSWWDVTRRPRRTLARIRQAVSARVVAA